MSDKKQITAEASLIEQLVSKRDFEDVGCHLTELEVLGVTAEHLQETDVPWAVYRVLKNCPTGTLNKKAKHLLSQWKAVCKPQGSPGPFPVGGAKENGPELSPDPSQHEIPSISGSASLPSSQDTPAEAVKRVVPGDDSDQARPPEEQFRAGDARSCAKSSSDWLDPVVPVRSKCTELLSTALAASPTGRPMADLSQDFAREIEEHVFTLHSKNLKKYKACIRSKVANLKNPKNSHLHRNLLSGTMSPREFAEMNALEMASEELKQLRASYTEASIQEHLLPQRAEGVHTAKIRCKRCDKFNCKVTAVSRGTLFLPGWVRSSNPDEEMMTFVICNECGEQWYHNKWVCL